jgi:hypothetical protein
MQWVAKSQSGATLPALRECNNFGAAVGQSELPALFSKGSVVLTFLAFFSFF